MSERGRWRRLASWAWGRPDPSGLPFMTRGARYSVVFLFLLSLLLAAGNYLLSASAVRRAEASSASTMQLCQAGNEARRQQVALWDKLIALSAPPPHETAAARARRKLITREFVAYVHTVFAPRNCAAVTGPGGAHG